MYECENVNYKIAVGSQENVFISSGGMIIPGSKVFIIWISKQSWAACRSADRHA